MQWGQPKHRFHRCCPPRHREQMSKARGEAGIGLMAIKQSQHSPLRGQCRVCIAVAIRTDFPLTLIPVQFRTHQTPRARKVCRSGYQVKQGNPVNRRGANNYKNHLAGVSGRAIVQEPRLNRGVCINNNTRTLYDE